MLSVIRTCTAFIILLCFASNVHATERVVFGVIYFPPSVTIDKSTGKCSGKVIQTVEEILSKTHFELSVLCTNPARLYKLISTGDVDFMINPKSTKAIAGNVDFIEPEYSAINVMLFQHKAQSTRKTISAIRGFNYHGYRSKLQSEGFRFVDLPDANEAIDLFLKQRTEYLISYNLPFMDRVSEEQLEKISGTHLVEIGTYIAISKHSDNRASLTKAFEHFAETNNLTSFNLAVPQ